jgi:hypothetical protein
MKKSSFMKTEFIYLGFIISVDKLRMDPDKVEVIKNWPHQRISLKFEVFTDWLVSTKNSLGISVELVHQ